jgi:hypothetical protein
MGPYFGPQKLFDPPTFSEEVDKAVSVEKLHAVASTITDPAVLFGLGCLARPGGSVWREIFERAAEKGREYGPIGAVFALMMDGVSESAVNEVIQRDPDNALGYYVQANVLYERDDEDAALESFRKGAHCSELRLYEPVTGAAIFKALDALQLEGRDRLCALSWMACRSSNFSAGVMQFLSSPLSDWSRREKGREEVCDLLLALGGHLFATNFYNRWAAKQALDHAIFGLKARTPTAEKFPTMRGLMSTMLRWPGSDVGENPDEPHKRLRLAQFLPDIIHRAFAAVDARNAGKACEASAKLSRIRKAAYEKAASDFVNSGRALIETALTDPDRIMGPYLMGIPTGGRGADGRQGVPFETDVEKLLRDRPEVFAAAAANREAMNAMWDTEASDPSRRNITRMMELNRAMHSYAAAHGDTYPGSVNVLFEKGYLQATFKPTSVLTGKPYVYPAAGDKVPAKSKDKWRFVVLYDDNPDEWDCYQCVFASWAGGGMRVAEVKEQLRIRGKSAGGL